MGKKKPIKPVRNQKGKQPTRVKRPKRLVAPKFFKNKELWIPAVVLLVITGIVFYPSLLNEFVNWDDDRNFYENPNLDFFNWDSIKAIFSSHVIGNYNPLTIFTFALEKHFFGFDQPFYWHLNNLILHLACCFFVYRIALELKLNWKFALLLAFLFGIHPMRVESVAWVTERKDVLYGVFFLSAMFLYIRHIKYTPKKWSVLLITLLFVLSLLSKIQAVIFPVSLLLVHYYLDKKISKKNMMVLGLFFILSLTFGILGIYFLQFQGSLESNATYPIGQRIFIGSYSFLVYIIKWIFPYKMSPLYPYPSSLGWMFYVSMIPALAIVAWTYWLYKKDKRPAVFGIAFFIVNIVLLLQVLGAGQGFLADRFTYIAYFGLFFLFAYYSQALAKAKPQWEKYLLGGLSLYLLLFAWMSMNQNKIWKNSGTLWTHVLKYHDNTTLPFGNRANYYRDNGAITQALSDYSSVLRLKPDNEKAYNSRGRLYFQNVSNSRDTLLLALQDYTKAIELKSDEAEYYINRGAVYARLGQIPQAMNDLNKGLETDPNNMNGYLNRSILLNQQGQYQAALNDITTYNSMSPYNPQLWFESARLKVLLNNPALAIADFDRALQLSPGVGIFYYERSKAHYKLNNLNQARSDLSQAQQRGINPDPNYVKLLQ